MQIFETNELGKTFARKRIFLAIKVWCVYFPLLCLLIYWISYDSFKRTPDIQLAYIATCVVLVLPKVGYKIPLNIIKIINTFISSISIDEENGLITITTFKALYLQPQHFSVPIKDIEIRGAEFKKVKIADYVIKELNSFNDYYISLAHFDNSAVLDSFFKNQLII